MRLNWTDDFSKFKNKVERFVGKLEDLADKAPDMYAHMVLSHGFMEYAFIKNLHDDIKRLIGIEKEACFDYKNEEHDKLYWKYLKDEYLNWARQNKLEEGLLEEGWEEYLND